MSEVNRYDIHIHQGETWTLTLTVKDSNNNPKNLTGYTAKMHIRDKPSSMLLKELSTTNGLITITGGLGEIKLDMTATDTQSLQFKDAQYDLFIYSPASTATPLLRGNVLVTQRITA